MAAQRSPANSQPHHPSSERLDSWKEIAAYLKRDLRTVQRWEEHEDLPVHRHLHGKLASVYAFRKDIDTWLASRQPEAKLEPEAVDGNNPAIAASLPLIAPQLAARRKALIYGAFAAVALVIGAGGSLVLQRIFPRRAARVRNSDTLAILPFEDLSPNHTETYVADGMTDDLITYLGETGQLPVICRTSVMKFKNTNEPLSQIAQSLHANLIVEGTILRSGDRVRVTAQLIDASKGQNLWADDYERDFRNVLTLQDDVAGDIAAAVEEKVTGNAPRHVPVQVVSADARMDYLIGNFLAGRRDEASLRSAVSYLKQSVAKDPDYSPAYARLAGVYALLSGWGDLPASESFKESEAAAARALHLDETNAEAHAALGLVKTYYEWDFGGAEKEFRRAIQLNPEDRNAHHWYAYCLLLLRRPKRATNEIATAQRLDPLSPIINTDYAEILFLTGQDQQAIQQAQKTIRIDPYFGPAHTDLGLTDIQLSRFRNAINELRQSASLSGNSPVALSNLAYAYAIAGERKQALQTLTTIKRMRRQMHVNGERFALIYVGLGRYGKAVQWLERAVEEGDRSEFCNVMLLPAYDKLRSDPRFRKLLSRIDFPQ